MTGNVAEPLPDAVVVARPTEDAGAATSGYYEFQYGWVASHAFEMLRRSELQWILCEWHTDFILGWGSSFAPVSVKHREPDSGRWTVALLFSDGGLRILFSRWMALGCPHECRWVTNGGLDADCRRLQSACRNASSEYIAGFIDEHLWRFGDAGRDDVAKFLAALRIDNDSSRAADQRIVNIEKHARPALQFAGLSTLAATRAYDEVVSLARTASQGFSEYTPDGWTGAAEGALDEAALLAAASSRRLLKRDDVSALLSEIAGPAAADQPAMTPTMTTLIKKLKRGRVVPTAEFSARRSRVQWTAFEASYEEPIPADDRPSEFESLRAVVMAAAADAQLLATQGGEPYGDRMLLDVRTRMHRIVADGPLSTRGVTADLLMGLVYDLTARCEVWWSPWFDVNVDDALGSSG